MSTNFAYTVMWVPDVEKTVEFYEKAFALKRRTIQHMGAITWGEMETASTTLAFSSESEAAHLFADGFYENRADRPPAMIQISFTTDDVAALYKQAISAGATKHEESQKKPWGQIVSRVRDLNGVLVSIVSPFTPQAK